MGRPVEKVECRVSMLLTFCYDFTVGASFAFNPFAGTGTIGNIFGNVFSMETNSPDPMNVKPFMCLKG